MKPEIILASQSPRRRELLRGMGLKFRIIPSDCDESNNYARPSALVRNLALRKAKTVAAKHPEALVIGSDTIVVCKGRILGKPKDQKDALRLLALQNNSWQSVYTGVAVICGGKEYAGYEVSRCRARKLSIEELTVLSHKHHDKAGAYAVQDDDDRFIKKIVGPRDNVVGLPCGLLTELLAKAGFNPAK